MTRATDSRIVLSLTLEGLNATIVTPIAERLAGGVTLMSVTLGTVRGGGLVIER